MRMLNERRIGVGNRGVREKERDCVWMREEDGCWE